MSCKTVEFQQLYEDFEDKQRLEVLASIDNIVHRISKKLENTSKINSLLAKAAKSGKKRINLMDDIWFYYRNPLYKYNREIQLVIARQVKDLLTGLLNQKYGNGYYLSIQPVQKLRNDYFYLAIGWCQEEDLILQQCC
jgi:hypothetical protein